MTIKDLYQMGIFRYMNSCLIEVLDTAFARFAKLDICEALEF
jgi:hypothetical protein